MAAKKCRSAPAPRKNVALSPPRQRFCEEYLIDLNATKAAMRAGYSVHTAHVQAARLMADKAIHDEVQRLMDARSKRTSITAERVLQELSHVAFADIGHVISVDDHGKVTIKNLDKVPEEARRAIAEIRQTSTEVGGEDGSTVAEDVRLSIKHHPKIQALKMLVDHLGLNAPVKQEIVVEARSAKDSLREKLNEMRQKLRPDEPGGADGAGSGEGA